MVDSASMNTVNLDSGILNDARLRCGLLRMELYRKAGVSPCQGSLALAGKPVGVRTARRLCAILGLKLADCIIETAASRVGAA